MPVSVIRHRALRAARLLSSGLMAAIMVCGLVPSAHAAINGFTIVQSKSGGSSAALNIVNPGNPDQVSGIPVCPANPTPGCDFSDTDALVRTHDVVEYFYGFNNVGTDTNVVITATAPLGMVWDRLPAFCGAGSTINNDPRPFALSGSDGILNPSVLVCNVTQAGGFTNSTNSYPLQARVLGVPHNTQLQPSGSVRSTETTTALTASGPVNVVTAAPRLDLQKKLTRSTFETVAHAGNPTMVVARQEYTLSIMVDSSVDTRIGGSLSIAGRVGHAPVIGPITFTDKVLNQMPAGTFLDRCDNYSTDTEVPASTFSTSQPNRSVLSSGSLACTQSADGANVSLTWTGVDTTLNHVPTQKSSNGAALTGGQDFVAVGRIVLMVPAAILPTGTSAVTNCLINFDPDGQATGVAGSSNFFGSNEPGYLGTGNNCAGNSINKINHQGTSNKSLLKDVNTLANYVGTNVNAGDGIIVAGGTFATRLDAQNSGVLPMNNFQVCDVWDNRKQRLKAIDSGPSKDSYFIMDPDAIADVDAEPTVHYSTGYVTSGFPDAVSFPNAAAIRNECAVADSNWLLLSPGADVKNATKVRITYKKFNPGKYFIARLNFEALSANPATPSQAWPSGTLIPDWHVVRANELNGTLYSDSTYNPGANSSVAHTGGGSGDRAILTAIAARVNLVTLNAQGTASDNSLNSAAPSTVVSYAIKPSLQGPAGSGSSNVNVYSILPLNVSYMLGSGKISISGGAFNAYNPSAIDTCSGSDAPVPGCANGRQYLTWNLSGQSAGQQLPEIRYSITVPQAASNGSTLLNNAVVVAQGDISSQALRTADRLITVDAPANLTINELVSTPKIDAGGSFSYTVTYENKSIEPLSKPEFISILPANGDGTGTWSGSSDGRTPASNYTGTRTLQSVTASTTDGAVLYVTNVLQSSINKAPNATANLNPGVGSSMWCRATITNGVVTVAGGQPAGCAGTTAATLTAIRVVDNDTTFVVTDGSRNYVMAFSTAGNAVNNVYTNDTGGFATGLTLPVISPDVTVTVASGSINGNVYRDDNNNGTKDPGELGLPNVTITLCNVATVPCPPANKVAEQQTIASGDYSFIGLPAGTYYLSETQPANYSNGVANAPGTIGTTPVGAASGPNAFQSIVLPVGAVASNYNFSEISTLATLQGRVFAESNNNGVFDGTDKGLEAVTLTLTGGTLTAPQVITTDKDGLYSVTVTLSATPYVITQTQPAGFADGKDVLGTGALSATAVVGAPLSAPMGAGGGVADVGTGLGVGADRYAAIVANTSNAIYGNFNFAENANDTGLVVSGNVFNDPNGLLGTPANTVDGTGTQAGVSTLTVYLVQNGLVVASAPVGANGAYAMTNVPKDTGYTVVLANTPTVIANKQPAPAPSLPAGWANTGENTGVAAGSDGTVNGTSAAFDLSTTPITQVNFGIEQPPVAGAAVLPPQSSTGVPIAVPVGAFVGSPLGTLPTGMTGTVATDSTGINTITITQLPSGAQSVTINGVTYTAQTFPPAGVTVTLVQLANLSVVPLITATEVVIFYVARDDAGLPSSTGTVKIPLVQSPDLRLTMTTPTTPLTVGNNATYTLQVTNVGPFPTSSTMPLMTVVDTLPPNVQYVSATGLNWTCSAAGLVSTGQVVTCTSTQPLPANTGTASPITLVVKPLDAVVNTTVLNKASVQGGGETQTNYDLATPANSGTPNANNNSQLSTFVQQAASLSGVVWRDTDHNRKYDSNESPIAGFIVEVVDANDNVIATTTTDASGSYRFTGLPPNQPLKVRFRNPGTNNVVSGTPTNNDQTADTRVNSVRSDAAGTSTIAPSELVVNLTPGNNLGNQSLPLDPAGVVYDSLTRLPVGNATVTLLRNNSPVPATDVVGGLSTMTTCGPLVSATCPLPGGYQFLLNPTAPAGTYTIRVSAPGYVSPSVIIPVTAASFTPETGPGQVQSINLNNVLGNPPPQVGQNTTYYLNFVLNPSSSKGIVNNHIPLDPQTRYSLFTSKAADRTVVELGDSVKYTVTVERLDTVASVQTRVFVADLLPAGFNYMPGTLTVNGQPVTDASVGLVGRGPVLNMSIANANLQPNRGNVLTLTYRVRLGVGSLEGTGINQVQANLPGLISNPVGLPNCSSQPQLCSNIAQAKVKVTAGVFTTEACVVGKVYVDCNNNQVQDNEELGIPGVRMYMEDGRGIVTDVEGKYSFCGLSPKTHVLKLDATTMPARSRVIVSSNRNAGDPGSLFVDAKKGELVRADFIEGSCSHPVIEQVKARRSQGEVRTVESETSGISLKWNAKPPADPQQATDSANQPLVQPRAPLGSALGNRQ